MLKKLTSFECNLSIGVCSYLQSNPRLLQTHISRMNNVLVASFSPLAVLKQTYEQQLNIARSTTVCVESSLI